MLGIWNALFESTEPIVYFAKAHASLFPPVRVFDHSRKKLYSMSGSGTDIFMGYVQSTFRRELMAAIVAKCIGGQHVILRSHSYVLMGTRALCAQGMNAELMS